MSWSKLAPSSPSMLCLGQSLWKVQVCKCSKCLDLYKDSGTAFLMDETDTVHHYENQVSYLLLMTLWVSQSVKTFQFFTYEFRRGEGINWKPLLNIFLVLLRWNWIHHACSACMNSVHLTHCMPVFPGKRTRAWHIYGGGWHGSSWADGQGSAGHNYEFSQHALTESSTVRFRLFRLTL